MDIPAKAPTMVRGAVKLIFPADSMTNWDTGDSGPAHSSPRMVQ